MAKHKLGAIWNQKSFQDAQAKIPLTKFSDATAGVILASALERVNTEIYEQRGINETFLSIGIPIDNTGGYENTIQSLKRKIEGDYKQTGTGDHTTGTITLSGEDSILGVQGYEASSSWSFVELKQAELGGTDVVSALMSAHNTKYLKSIDDIGYTGVGGTDGILNHADLNVVTASAVWTGMTNVELTNEIVAFIATQREGRNQDFWCDTLVVQPSLLTRLETSNAFDGYENTIKEHVSKTLNVKFVATENLTDAGTTANTTAMVALCTNKAAIAFRIPLQFMMSEVVQNDAWKYSFKSMFRIGGIDMLETVHYKLDNF